MRLTGNISNGSQQRIRVQASNPRLLSMTPLITIQLPDAGLNARIHRRRIDTPCSWIIRSSSKNSYRRPTNRPWRDALRRVRVSCLEGRAPSRPRFVFAGAHSPGVAGGRCGPLRGDRPKRRRTGAFSAAIGGSSPSGSAPQQCSSSPPRSPRSGAFSGGASACTFSTDAWPARLDARHGG